VEYTSMLLSVHAIEGSASAPTAEHQRRRPRTAGDRAGKQNRQFIGALVEPRLARIKRSSIQKPHLTCNNAGARHAD